MSGEFKVQSLKFEPSPNQEKRAGVTNLHWHFELCVLNFELSIHRRVGTKGITVFRA